MKKISKSFVAKGIFFLLLLFAVGGAFLVKVSLQRRLWPEVIVGTGVALLSIYHSMLVLYALVKEARLREILSLMAMDITYSCLYVYSPLLLWRASIIFITTFNPVPVIEFTTIWLGIRFVFLPFLRQALFGDKK